MAQKRFTDGGKRKEAVIIDSEVLDAISGLSDAQSRATALWLHDLSQRILLFLGDENSPN